MCRPKLSHRASWSDRGAPIATDPFKYSQLAWLPFLSMITKISIDALDRNLVAASLFWIIYESYIVFDHFPFFFTNNVYKSPKFNYNFLSLIFFWGMEAVASIVATQSAVGAPIILLYNAFPHIFFIYANYVRRTATSNAFVAEQDKNWLIFSQVVVDTTIHITQLWFHIKHIHRFVCEDANDLSLWPLIFWKTLIVLSIFLTWRMHKDEMSWTNATKVWSRVSGFKSH